MSDPTFRLTRAQVREIDRRAIEQYHIPGIVLMENAAWAVTQSAIEMLAAARKREAMVLCGVGNNGGDGLAVARHLHISGFKVSVAVLGDSSRYKGDALTNWMIVRAMAIPVSPITPALIKEFRAGLFIDAIYGTGLAGPTRDPFYEISSALLVADRPVLAVDIPSGLDADTGECDDCILATRTVTFVAEKAGFADPDARKYTGEIVVGDIGCPRELIEQVLRDIPA